MKKNILKNWFTILVAFFTLLIFLINTFHESYPDEMVKILGGNYITRGRLPFKGFFSNHGPVGYFTSFLINIFSGASFVKFRIFYSFFLFLLTRAACFLLASKSPK